MPGPWPVTLITWNQLQEDAEPPTFEFGGVRLFKGPGGKKGPSYLGVFRNTGNTLELAKSGTPNPGAWAIDAIGTYNIIDEASTTRSLGESCQGLMIGLTDCRSEEDEEAFNKWYRDVHAADVLKAGFHERAFRYRNQESAGSPKYCALYETRQGGFESFKALMLHYRDNPSPVAEFCVVRHVWALETV